MVYSKQCVVPACPPARIPAHTHRRPAAPQKTGALRLGAGGMLEEVSGNGCGALACERSLERCLAVFVCIRIRRRGVVPCSNKYKSFTTRFWRLRFMVELVTVELYVATTSSRRFPLRDSSRVVCVYAACVTRERERAESTALAKAIYLGVTVRGKKIPWAGRPHVFFYCRCSRG